MHYHKWYPVLRVPKVQVRVVKIYPYRNSRRAVSIELTHLDNGRYGWRAEAEGSIGVREYGSSEAEVLELITRHYRQETTLTKPRKGDKEPLLT